MIHVLALIPARCGSRSIRHKNIRRIGGRPLLAHAIDHARRAKAVTRVIVSTDSPRYARLARRFGAEAPFLRPAKHARNISTDLEVFRHALDWLERKEGYRPDIIVHLRPTCPRRAPGDIDAMIRMLRAAPRADSVRSVARAPLTPYKMWLFGRGSRLVPAASCAIPEAYNRPRQELPTVYVQNACVDVVRARIVRSGSMTGRNILGYRMEHFLDIDTEEDLRRARRRWRGE